VRGGEAGVGFLTLDSTSPVWRHTDRGARRRRVRVEAVYFDTEDLGLARAGVTLRRRLARHDAGWHGREAESPRRA